MTIGTCILGLGSFVTWEDPDETNVRIIKPTSSTTMFGDYVLGLS